MTQGNKNRLLQAAMKLTYVSNSRDAREATLQICELMRDNLMPVLVDLALRPEVNEERK